MRLTEGYGLNMENKLGRPIEYSEETLKKTLEYISKCEDEIYIFQKMSGKTDGFEEKIRTRLPSIAGLALYLDVARDTVYDWESKYKDFSYTLTRIRAMQEQALLDGGLSGRYNPIITKLILATNHGYRENKDITTNGKDLPTPIYGGKSDNI